MAPLFLRLDMDAWACQWDTVLLGISPFFLSSHFPTPCLEIHTNAPKSTDEERFAILDRAWELGCTNWDTSDYYGDSEDLIGKWFRLHPERRADIFLATKFGITYEYKDGAHVFGGDNSPGYARQQVERSLKKLGIESIDLFYIHRLDGKTPIETVVGALKELKELVYPPSIERASRTRPMLIMRN